MGNPLGALVAKDAAQGWREAATLVFLALWAVLEAGCGSSGLPPGNLSDGGVALDGPALDGPALDLRVPRQWDGPPAEDGLALPDGGWHRRDGCEGVNLGGGFSFANAVVSRVDHPGWIVVRDFDADGREDIAFVGGARSDEVWVLRSLGDGTMAAPARYPIMPRGAVDLDHAPLTASDLNGDGRADLVTSSVSGVVSVLLAEPGGKFAKALTSGPIPSGRFGAPSTGDIAVGDLNGDHIPDVFAAGLSSGELFGTGDGRFVVAPDPAPPSIPAKDQPLYRVALADFDGNGTTDYAVCDQQDGLRFASGQGDGSFVRFKPDPQLRADCLHGLLAVDLNHDGRIDVLTAGVDAVDSSLGNGDGSFQPARLVVAPGDVRSGQPDVVVVPLAVADFDGDGDLDIAGAGYINKEGVLAICRGNGDGTFQEPQGLGPLPNAGWVVYTGDFNGDCRPDVLLSDWENGPVYLYLNTSP